MMVLKNSIPKESLYGLMAMFADEEALLAAVKAARRAGYRRIDAYSPFMIEGMSEALGLNTVGLPFITLLGGVLGGLIGYLLQYWTSVIAYPLNVGGRPLHSWPAFIPVTFEAVILGAALAAVTGMFMLNGLPQPYHPVFNAPDFDKASRNRFFLAIEAGDPKFNREKTHRFLESLGAEQVSEVQK